MNISCLEELQMKLELCVFLEDKRQLLNEVGSAVNDCGCWFIVTDDGQCYLFDKDGNLDDVSKATVIDEFCIRKDIKCICIPSSVTVIGEYAFWKCKGLVNVMIPSSVTNIGYAAFYGCSGLTSIVIPDGVTSIGDYAFYGCSSLTSVTIPDSVVSIGRWTFSDCKGLMNMTIRDGVTSIGYGAFFYCSGLTHITFKGKTLDKVKAMDNYPWGIKDESIIHVE